MNEIFCEWVDERGGHPIPIMPTARKTLRLLRALQAGERITVAKALTDYGVYACSQEMGRLRRLGWDIQSKRIAVSPGVHVCEYYL